MCGIYVGFFSPLLVARLYACGLLFAVLLTTVRLKKTTKPRPNGQSIVVNKALRLRQKIKGYVEYT